MSGIIRRPSVSLAPARNGFLNRLIFTTPGSFNFVVPPLVSVMKIAVFGAGGGGALVLTGNFNSASTSGETPVPGSGAGPGFAQAIVAVTPGQAIPYVVGQRGFGGIITAPNNSNPVAGNAPGSNGGTSSVTVGSRTISATGGQGGPVVTDTAHTGAVGGAGSGGDVNANGGNGGPVSNTTTEGYKIILASAAGASGSPRGTGGRGGPSVAFSTGGSSYYVSGPTGGGWGGDGVGYWGSSNSAGGHAYGGGALGPGRSNYGHGHYRASFNGLPAIASQYNTAGNPNEFIADPRMHLWWDLDEIAGASGPDIAGPGAGGGCEYGSVPGGATRPPGWFGGAAPQSLNGGSSPSYRVTGNVTATSGLVVDSPVAGGGGAIAGAPPNNIANAVLRAGNGGPGCVIFWF